MRLFLSGATGFIGKHLLREAGQRGHSISALARPCSDATLPAMAGVRWHRHELAEVPDEVFNECDVVLHFAAAGVLTDTTDWDNCFKVNLTDSLALWRRAVGAGVKRFIICGSCFEYGKTGECMDRIPVNASLEPVGAYAASKAAATAAASGLAHSEQLDMVVLRPFHVYGEGEAESRFWPSLKRAALSGADFPMSSGGQVRDFIPVESVARQVIDLAETMGSRAQSGFKIENQGTGKACSLLDFAQHWWKVFEATGSLKPGAVPYRANEVMRYVPESSK